MRNDSSNSRMSEIHATDANRREAERRMKASLDETARLMTIYERRREADRRKTEPSAEPRSPALMLWAALAVCLVSLTVSFQSTVAFRGWLLLVGASFAAVAAIWYLSKKTSEFQYRPASALFLFAGAAALFVEMGVLIVKTMGH